MKFEVNTKELKNLLDIHKKLKICAGAYWTLNDIKFDIVDNNTIEIMNTNLETTVISKINANINNNEQNCFIADFKTVNHIIDCNDDVKTVFELLADKKCKIDKMKINTDDIDEFPLKPCIDFEKSRILNKLSFKDFTESANKIIKFASTDETRAVLTGILFDTTNKCLVASDSYRLGKAFYLFTRDIGKFVVPSSVVKLLTDIYKKFKTDIFSIILEENQITFNIANIAVTARLLNGKYPDYEHLFPNTWDYQYKINSKDLIKCIDKTQKLLKDIPAKFNFNTVKAVITAKNKAVGEYEDEIKVNRIKGNDNFEIGFNTSYLREGLENFEDFNFYANESLKPVMLKNDDTFEYYLMPMKIKEEL